MRGFAFVSHIWVCWCSYRAGESWTEPELGLCQEVLKEGAERPGRCGCAQGRDHDSDMGIDTYNSGLGAFSYK